MYNVNFTLLLGLILVIILCYMLSAPVKSGRTDYNILKTLLPCPVTLSLNSTKKLSIKIESFTITYE